jgi:hypothetical protein
MSRQILCSLLALALALGPSLALAQDVGAVSAPPVGAQAASAPVAPPAPMQSASVAVTPAGQWVSTSQYGWVWLPYEQSYTYVDAGGDAAYMYVYYPAFGWRWVASPWVLGLGPEPHWGVHGRVGFVWYSHPWFHPRAHVAYRVAPRFVRPARPFHEGGHRR